MIPKKIHYCWFGRGQMPESAKYYINSWKKELPDYELKLWNEDTFDINSNCYVKEAYESKKFAFVTDYVRLYALYTEGGIYMDTDVEVLRNLDIFLCHKAFSGFESLNQVPTGIMGSEKGLSIIKELLDYYNDKHFIDENGNMDLTTNVDVITNYMLKKGLIPNNTYQEVDNFTFYEKEVFCPMKRSIGEKYSKETYTIHHFEGSWLPESERKKRNSKIYKFRIKIVLTIIKILLSLLGREKLDQLKKVFKIRLIRRKK